MRRVVERVLASRAPGVRPALEARFEGRAAWLVERARHGEVAALERLADRWAVLAAGRRALFLVGLRDLEAGHRLAAARAFARLLVLWPDAPEAERSRARRALADARRTGFGAAATGAATARDPSAPPARLGTDLHRLWSRTLPPVPGAEEVGAPGRVVEAGLAPLGEDVLLHDTQAILRLDAMTGRVRWRFPRRDPARPPVATRDLRYAAYDRPLRDVQVAGGLVLAVLGMPGGTGSWTASGRTWSLDDFSREARLRLVALDATTGALVWATGRVTDTHPVLGDPRAGVASPPLVVGDRIYVLFSRREGAARATLACLELATGTPRWVVDLASGESGRSHGARPGQRRFVRPHVQAAPWGARPALAEGEILALPHAGFCAGVDARDGQVHWLHALPRYADGDVVGIGEGFSARNAPLAFRGAWWLAPMDAPRLVALEIGTGRQRLSLPAEDEDTLARLRHLLGPGWSRDGGPALLFGGEEPLRLALDDGAARLEAPGSWGTVDDPAIPTGRPWCDGERMVRAGGGLTVYDWARGEVVERRRVGGTTLPRGDVVRAGPVWVVVGVDEVVAVASDAAVRDWIASRPADPVARAVEADLDARPSVLTEILATNAPSASPVDRGAVLARARRHLPDAGGALLDRVDALLCVPLDEVAQDLYDALARAKDRAPPDAVVARLDRWIEADLPGRVETREGLVVRGDLAAASLLRALAGHAAAAPALAEREQRLRRRVEGAQDARAIAALARQAGGCPQVRGEALRRLEAVRHAAGLHGLAAAAVGARRLLLAAQPERTDRAAAAAALELREAEELLQAGEIRRAAAMLSDLGTWAPGGVRRRAARRFVPAEEAVAWAPAPESLGGVLDLWSGVAPPHDPAELASVVVPHLVGPGAARPRERLVVFRGLDVEVWDRASSRRIASFSSDGGGWFGGSLQGVADWLPEGGVLVTSLVPTEPADRAGLRPGDWIVSWNGGRLPSGPVFMHAVGRMEKGRAIPVGVYRGGRPVLTRFEPGERPWGQGLVMDRDTVWADADGRLLVPDRLGLYWVDPDAATKRPLWAWSGPSGVVGRVDVLLGQAVVTVRGQSDGDALVAVDLGSGRTRWRADLDGAVLEVGAAASTVWAVTRAPDALTVFDAEDGRFAWSLALQPSADAAGTSTWIPSTRVGESRGRLFTGAAAGDLANQAVGIDPTTGEPFWEGTALPRGSASLFAADRYVLYGDADEIVAMDPDPVDGHPLRRGALRVGLPHTPDVRLWTRGALVWIVSGVFSERTGLAVLRIGSDPRRLALSPVSGSRRTVGWRLGEGAYLLAARLAPEGLFLSGASRREISERATVWIGADGRQWAWTEPDAATDVRRSPWSRFGDRIYGPVDRGMRVIPTAASIPTRPR